ncbi:hypothetical protein GUITHDRAFT_117637 [Guillardia theta CCMP2712]|uniref:Uncharacterized protein n=1 Tax=Guillardia theta (strain CCMP2712) TaxID=905079 RepID=L1IJ46_GUITC|nr:hypothetical protein GUITHDRAFT_117637 [Guillardia theta CCMP2712]EKX36132.1 hypothetical protein GUITHDRAFT_117637 [Guillardia theta CCMP2712]|eukprot:XP_005823112.1 hypothetical protein GUITHDRAFT_117637 [Guillardia theta CCMP2712]
MSQRPKRRCVEDAMNRVREVLEWEQLDERSAQFRSVAQALEAEFERERLMRRTCPEILQEDTRENSNDDDEDEGEEDSGASEVSFDSDWYPGKKGGGFFRYDEDGESEAEDESESEEADDIIIISDELADDIKTEEISDVDTDILSDTDTENLSDTETVVDCNTTEITHPFSHEGSIASSNGPAERQALEADGDSFLSSLGVTGNATACEDGGPLEVMSRSCLEAPEP